MENSLFGRLPPELRNRIWQYALVHDRPIELVPVGTPGDSRAFKAKYECDGAPSPELLRTCKAIYDETHQIFYGANRIEAVHQIPNGDGENFFQSFVAQIGAQHAKSLREVHLTIFVAVFDEQEAAEAARKNYYPLMMRTIGEAQQYPRCLFRLQLRTWGDWEIKYYNAERATMDFAFRGDEGGYASVVKKVAEGVPYDDVRHVIGLLHEMVSQELEAGEAKAYAAWQRARLSAKGQEAH